MAAKNRTVLTKEAVTQGFSRVTEPLELHRLLRRAIESHAKSDVRLMDPVKGRGLRFQSVVMDSSHTENGLFFEAPTELEAHPEMIQGSEAGEVMIISFLRGQMLLCVHAQSSQWKDKILTVKPPWSVFKLQRRKEPRFEIPKAYELSVTMESPEDSKRRIARRIFDISEHGLGFEIPSTRDPVPYKKGMFIKRMQILVENHQIFFDARVANIMPITGKAVIKIGVEIIRMSPVDARFIAAYVARNLVQFYG